MASIDKFVINLVKLNSLEKCVGIRYESSTIIDYQGGYLWRWGSLPLGIDTIDGKIIIEGIDDITGDVNVL
jgi:hypothetical protein